MLLVLAVLGASVLAAAAHFASLLLGLELLGVALYGLIAYPASRPGPVEAGTKYLVLAGVASAVLVFGMACVYGATGSLRLADAAAGGSPLAEAGLVLMLLGLFFKLALVPLHMWTPDVYVGAPAPVTALVATVSKGSVLVVLWRVMALRRPTCRPPPTSWPPRASPPCCWATCWPCARPTSSAWWPTPPSPTWAT